MIRMHRALCRLRGSGHIQETNYGGVDGGDHEDGHRDGGVFTAEAGRRGDATGGDPLDEPEQRRAGA